ncbi:MAG: cobaltochelatase subunit CobN [Luteolibacter sp.]
MRPGSVGEANWQEMKNVLVDDTLKLSLREWFERTNPYAFQDATATLIEAVRKGYWNPDAAMRGNWRRSSPRASPDPACQEACAAAGTNRLTKWCAAT